ncbi:restriction endonuclease subunit S [Geobacter grbiciae]|uniref:restriction endonuclease subunit S n=1 Tax=Geobacter grbiciae TaxID=155042 RepID=UPI001C02339E|nr:restriction endonuclease subunit S [Geobacter grbiciae]MBT1073946.1 restriction endonuclease subunit S [Geobacter grbiciae]
MSSLAQHSWQEIVFDQIVKDSAFGPRFPGTAYADDGNIATLRTTDISADGHISYDTMPLAQLDEAAFANHFLKPGDLVITRSGRIGTTAIFEGHDKLVLPGAFLIRFRLSEEANPHFFCYWFNSTLGQQRLLSVARGAAQQNINITNVKTLKVPLPPLQGQQSIVSILSSFDNLIENNRRRIQLLEQAARLLYKEWFVHLRFPGHEHTRIIDGVPEGWGRKKIAEVCETIGGGTPSTKVSEYWDGDITWVVPSDITNNNSLILPESERKITAKGLRESSAKMVPAETILMTSRASVGFFALMDHEVCTNQGFINIVPHDNQSRMYLLFNLLSRVNEIRSNAKGTTYPEISKGRFREMDIIIPCKTLMNQFGEIAYDIIRQIRCLMRSNANLAKARDIILPKLMNGEVVV